MRPIEAFVMVFALAGGLQAGQSPFSGTWKLNPTKSTISAPSPRSETVHVEADENGIEVITEIVEPATGKPTKGGYKAKFDGNDYPVAGDPHVDSVAYQRVDANTLKAIAKKGGKVVSEYTVVVSKDGRTTTVSYTETDAQGNSYKGSEVYERQ